MSRRRQLKRLAKLVFRMTRREVWAGGKGSFRWPKEVAPKLQWSAESTWTLSPEVELAGHRVRVCVSYNVFMDREGVIHDYDKRGLTQGAWHRVLVFIDDEEVYPGGRYLMRNFWPTWSKRIAVQEHIDGGKTGPVDRADLLIADAIRQLKAVTTVHPEPKQITTKAPEEVLAGSKEYMAALAEVERITQE